MPPRSIPWMAPNGGKQEKSSGSSKRKREEVVDLTGDLDTRQTPKTSRTSSTRTPSHSQSSAAGNRSLARTPSWTQPSPSSQRSRTAQVPPWTPPQQHSQAERDVWLQEEDNDIFENVASSQSPPVAHDQYQKYGSLDTKIVGVRFTQALQPLEKGSLSSGNRVIPMTPMPVGLRKCDFANCPLI